METYSASDDNAGPDPGPAAISAAVVSNSNPLNVPLVSGLCNSGNLSARHSPKVSVTPASQLMVHGNSSSLPPSAPRKIMSKNNNNTS